MDCIRRIDLIPTGFAEVPAGVSEFLPETCSARVSTTRPLLDADYVQLNGRVLFQDGECVVLSCGGLLAAVPRHHLSLDENLDCIQSFFLYTIQDR